MSTWGYLAVFVFVLMESSGIPLPGETMLLTAAVYAGLGHLSIQWVISLAVGGAIVGDNLGYLAGRVGGYRLVRRYGKFIHLSEERLARVEKFYRHHGNKTVFFGRFFAVLRTWAAFLAGLNRMPWPEFLLFNATGGILWAVIYGILGYKLAQNLPLLQNVIQDWKIGSVFLVVVAAIVVAVIVLERRWLRRVGG
ncbi:MAG: DedA family protein [Chloroflexi bacterium]|nr:DedA family protein [Chloroflexota bacterium]